VGETDRHRLAEERSLELHRLVARRVEAEPELIGQARRRVVVWRDSAALHGEYAAIWLGLLDGPLDALLCALLDEGERGRELRQTSPFTFVVPPRERWRLWREAREARAP
jgi:hypothetical protein